MTDSPTRRRRFRFATFEADLRTRELTHDGVRLAVQDKPFRVLEALLLARGDVVSREELAEALWPEGHHVAAEMGINTAVRKLRQALGDSAREPRFIATVPRRGYRLLPAAEGVREPLARSGAESDDARAEAARRRPSLGRRSRLAAGLVAALAAGLVLWAVGPALDSREAGPAPGAASASVRPLPAGEGARRSFLAALHLKEQGTPEAAEKCVQLLEEVVGQEPDFAPAHGELALALVHRAVRGARECETCEARARQALLRARELAPRRAATLLAEGVLAIHFDWDWQRAEDSLRRAVEVDPDGPETHLIAATWKAISGRHEESLVHVRRAVALDPGSFLVRSDAGFFYLAADRDAQAAAECRLALEVDPSFTPARQCLLLASSRLGAYAEAGRQARLLMAERGATGSEMAALEAAAGRSQMEIFWRFHQRLLEALGEAASPVARASVLAQLDEPEAALAWLERALAERHPEIVFLHLYAELKPLRGRPELESLSRRLGLGDPGAGREA